MNWMHYLPFVLSRPFQGHIEACPEPVEGALVTACLRYAAVPLLSPNGSHVLKKNAYFHTSSITGGSP